MKVCCSYNARRSEERNLFVSCYFACLLFACCLLVVVLVRNEQKCQSQEAIVFFLLLYRLSALHAQRVITFFPPVSCRLSRMDDSVVLLTSEAELVSHSVRREKSLEESSTKDTKTVQKNYRRRTAAEEWNS